MSITSGTTVRSASIGSLNNVLRYGLHSTSSNTSSSGAMSSQYKTPLSTPSSGPSPVPFSTAASQKSMLPSKTGSLLGHKKDSRGSVEMHKGSAESREQTPARPVDGGSSKPSGYGRPIPNPPHTGQQSAQLKQNQRFQVDNRYLTTKHPILILEVRIVIE